VVVKWKINELAISRSAITLVYLWPDSAATVTHYMFGGETKVIPKEGMVYRLSENDDANNKLTFDASVMAATFVKDSPTKQQQSELLALGFRAFTGLQLTSALDVEKERLVNMYRNCQETRGYYKWQEMLNEGKSAQAIRKEVMALLQNPKATNKIENKVHEYRIREGILQRRIFDSARGTREWFTLVPQGAWSSVEESGRVRPMSLRKKILLLYHHTYLGAHKGRDATMSNIMEAGLWWKSLSSDVNYLLKSCDTCTADIADTIVTGSMRARDLYGPFRELQIDFVGPIEPQSKAGHKYIFSCICPFSGWVWLIPTLRNDSATAAENLAERVICDIAGCVPIISCDRGPEFTSALMLDLQERLGIHRALGTAYHPETRGHVERSHRDLNALLRKLSAEEGENWHRLVAITQWTIRTTPKPSLGGYSPYEIITGLKPFNPMDALLHPKAKEIPSSHDYVRNLVRYLRTAHSAVRQFIADSQRSNEEQKVAERASATLEIGDHVLIKKAPNQQGERVGKRGTPGATISKRLTSKTFDTIYEVVTVMDKSAVLSIPSTGSTNLGFPNPVSQERLVRVQTFPTVPYERADRGINIGDRKGRIEGVSFDGFTSVRFEDNPEEPELLDLSRTHYTLFAK
jgi:hypothetical protein